MVTDTVTVRHGDGKKAFVPLWLQPGCKPTWAPACCDTAQHACYVLLCVLIPYDVVTVTVTVAVTVTAMIIVRVTVALPSH
jgi:hypothetical protein